ncbi:MAG TPA: biotin--[acetyl-CoA-carboxylase] ligase [Ignavibacteriaceae bacterium]|nr:biotin--[acetyl-CoA-carboxylase] ligase [Ignavibacteriaceae bacterium]
MFNIEAFDIKLNTEFIGRNFIYADEVVSTNTLLLDKKNNYNSNGTVLLAEKQTKGRGRKDRVWYSAPESNLTFSILLTKDRLLFNSINFLNFAASLSVATAIENLYQLKTSLKWPNDVLINSKKTSGILIESISQGSKIERVVIGIGVNVNQNSFQGTFNYPPTSIRNELGHNVDREKLMAEILNNFETLIEKIKVDKKELLKDWKLRCDMIGEKISILENDKEIFGIFDDIDDEGFLLLKTKDKIEKIHFGDITLGQ